MTQSSEQIVKDHLEAARKLRIDNRDPAKAAAFLLRAGIAEKTKKTASHPFGVRLAKHLR